MKLGKAFELFVKRILLHVGFTEVPSDGLYIFDGAPGQMIQGLGEAHNADVLVEPPVQTPFYARTRLLVECKGRRYKKVGLNTLRSVLGLREDINHFDIVDLKELKARRRQRRAVALPLFERYSYQVAVAAIDGYTAQAQKFAATYRIPLLQFDQLPFWALFCELVGAQSLDSGEIEAGEAGEEWLTNRILELADQVGRRTALAVTVSGQLLFLYRVAGDWNDFGETYSLHWEKPRAPWKLQSGGQAYLFQLPDKLMRAWLDTAANECEIRSSAINFKEEFLSGMAVYYVRQGKPCVKIISIDGQQLEKARGRLNRREQRGNQ